MTPGQFGGLISVYMMAVIFVFILIYQEARHTRCHFNLFFSLLYLFTFYFGFPLTCLLIFQFDVAAVPAEFLLYALLAATAFYAIYYVSYKTRLGLPQRHAPFFTVNRLESHFTWLLLAVVSVGTLVIFFLQNGFLLFTLDSYSQIFSKNEVSAVALKRFFYFFIPAMLVVYFLKQNVRAWWFFLASTVIFGILTYITVGGTRANLFVACALFLFIGMVRGWITLWMLIIAGSCSIVGMFWLALKRYGFDINGSELFYTFLYLTRDTFSPWENLGSLLQNYNEIDFQGIAPVIRDFYIFIPDWLWPERSEITWNTAKYFSIKLLDNYSVTISPTLIGSLIVMGGAGFIVPGAIVVGLIVKWFDWLYKQAQRESNRYKTAILQSFCFGAIFNIIVLVREGLDSFFSRMVFFGLVFCICLVVAKLLYWLFDAAGLIISPGGTCRDL